MWTYFRGWKRKVGVATLVMAFVFSLGWIRSYDRRDFLNLRLGDSVIRIASLGAHFKFIHVTPAADNQFGWDSNPSLKIELLLSFPIGMHTAVFCETPVSAAIVFKNSFGSNLQYPSFLSVCERGTIFIGAAKSLFRKWLGPRVERIRRMTR
jgi:hypothetical protein